MGVKFWVGIGLMGVSLVCLFAMGIAEKKGVKKFFDFFGEGVGTVGSAFFWIGLLFG